MILFLAALLIGVVTGLRTMTALAAVSWAAYLGVLDLSGSWASVMGATVSPFLLTAMAIGELVGDKLPQAPSRKAPWPFAGRVLIGAMAGAMLELPTGDWPIGLAAGALGAVIGTLGGYEARTRLAAAIGGRDLPVALGEDAVAVLGAAAVLILLT